MTLAGSTQTLAALPPESVEFLAAVEQRMLELVRRRGGAVPDAAVELIEAGGKRLRPLMVLAGRPCNAPDGPCFVHAAAAVELIHTASLVHDDLLDQATLRRGHQTTASRYGDERAVAVGDLLFSLAFTALTECRSHADDERTLAAVTLLATTSRTLAEGEAMQSLQVRDTTLAEADYLERCTRKTGVLFGAALELGALFGGAGVDDRALLRRFGCEVGLAFQLADDVLDCLAPDAEATIGKTPGTDVRDGTMTLPLLLAAAANPEIDAGLREHSPDVDAVLRLVAGTDALAQAADRAQRMAASALLLLDELRAPYDRRLLAALADRSVRRLS